jgi:hypothetical protein
MSSFYDDSSLVVIPSGYKTSKVYAEKPTDGSGDLAFTRTGDTATRVNSAGLIEKVRTNLVLQSQTFDNASWGKIGSTITANATAAPDGTATADSNIESAALAEHGVSQVLAISSGLNTISISVKANSRTRCRIGFANSSYGSMTAAQLFAYFDVSTGTVVQNISGGFSTIVDEGNGWYRCSVSQNLVAGDAAGAVQLLFIDSGINTYYTGNGTSGLFLWGGQLEVGDIATDYIPTTTAAVSVGPVANVPRLDYLGSSCPRLLLEPQRQNLVTFSESFDNAAWTKTNTTITANTAISPDGYQNADRAQLAAGALLFQSGLGSAGSNTLSVYAKATSGTSAKFRFFANGATLLSSDQTATGEWQRFTFTFTFSAVTAGISVATTGADDVLFYGFQHEIGAYATSYIPTLSASATRGADAASKTGISSLIGQTEGTLFLDFDFVSGVNANYGIIYQAAFTTYIYINQQTTGSITGQVQGVGGFAFTVAKPNGRYKCALAYKSGNSAFFVNGVQVGTTNTTTFTPTTIDIFSLQVGTETNTNNQALLFKTRLTNAEMQELTTL